MSRFCSGCGAPAPDNGAFCTKCGTALTPSPVEPPATPLVEKKSSATADMAGRSCPYCRFPLKEGGEVEPCPSCKAVHHADCWQENGGCAVNGCGATAGQAAATTALPPTPQAVPAAGAQGAQAPAPGQAPWPGPVTMPPGPSRGAREASKVALVALVILMALGGSAAALVISTSGNGSDATAYDEAGDTSTDVTTDYTDDTTTDYTDDTTTDYTDDTTTDYTDDTTYGAEGPAPYTEDEEGIATAAEEVITDHHDYISNASYNDAWQEFSPRYRENKLGDTNDEGESYSGGDMTVSPSLWDSDMGTEFPEAIDTSGIDVEFVKTTGDDDALVRVTGMTYTKDGAECPYTGLTWVHYEDEMWWYDPGTNHHPERRSEFGNGSTANELMRGRC